MTRSLDDRQFSAVQRAMQRQLQVEALRQEVVSLHVFAGALIAAGIGLLLLGYGFAALFEAGTAAVLAGVLP